MQRTYLVLVVASLTILAPVGGAVAAGFGDAGVDPDTGLGGLAQETGGLMGGLPDEVTTYGGNPGWHVAVDDKSALQDWANSSDQREILSYDDDSNTSVVAAPASDIGTGWLDRTLGNGLHARDYVQSVAVVQNVDTPEPPEPVSREQFEAPTGNSLLSSLPFVDSQSYDAAGIAMSEDANRSTLAEARDTINADGTPNGSGVTVAVLDDGTTYDQSLYGDRVVAARDFIGDRPATANNSYQNVSSASGHGSWVASAIAANASNSSYSGVAPEANLAIGKVLGNNGGTTADIIDGLDWACNEVDADIVSMSLGSQVYSAALDAAVQDCADNGTLVVIAAGNSAGTIPVGISSPADSLGEDPQSDGIMVVAATNTTANATDAGVAHFSQRGPDPGGLGEDITASRGADPTIAAPGMELTTMTADGPSTLSGTSMATPLVSGSAAVVLSTYPNANATDLEQRLAQGATPMPKAGVHEAGAGMVDVMAALNTEPGADEDYYTDQEESRTTAAEARDTAYESMGADSDGWFADLSNRVGA